MMLSAAAPCDSSRGAKPGFQGRGELPGSGACTEEIRDALLGIAGMRRVFLIIRQPDAGKSCTGRWSPTPSSSTGQSCPR